MWVKEEQNGRIYRKISMGRILHKILFFFKWLQANLAYIAHPWFVPRSQHVSKIKPSVYFCIIYMVEGWLSTHNKPIEH
jgi:hypothetical protein